MKLKEFKQSELYQKIKFLGVAWIDSYPTSDEDSYFDIKTTFSSERVYYASPCGVKELGNIEVDIYNYLYDEKQRGVSDYDFERVFFDIEDNYNVEVKLFVEYYDKRIVVPKGIEFVELDTIIEF